MAKRPSLKDKIMTPEKIEAAYQFLNKKTETEAEQKIEDVPAETPIPKPKKSKPKAAKVPKKKPTVKRAKKVEPIESEPNVRVTVDMPAQLHEDMKIMTIRRRETIRSFILSLIEKEVGKGS